MDFIKATEKLWKEYLYGDGNENYELPVDLFDPACVIIGTGRHEFFTSLDAFLKTLSKELEDHRKVRFQFRDFRCEQKQLGEDVCLVYGSIYIWSENKEQNIYINMDSRFSILYQREGDGWKIVHVHQSLPNMEQLDGEYYPKTLSEQIQEKQEELDTLTQLARTDSLTGLINYRALEEFFYGQKKENAWIFVIDLDHFKCINDTYGHVAGNHILQRVAAVLSSTVRSCDVVCRMGGDEFVLYCSGLKSEAAAGEFMRRILHTVEEAGKEEPCWIGMSIGGTRVSQEESLETVLKRADQALYDVKANGRKGYKIRL